MRPRGPANQLEARRHAAIKLLDQGYLPGIVAEKLHTTAVSVRRWKRAFIRNPKIGLRSRIIPGRTPKVTLEKLLKIAKFYRFGMPSVGVIHYQLRVMGVSVHPRYLQARIKKLLPGVEVKFARGKSRKILSR